MTGLKTQEDTNTFNVNLYYNATPLDIVKEFPPINASYSHQAFWDKECTVSAGILTTEVNLVEKNSPTHYIIATLMIPTNGFIISYNYDRNNDNPVNPQILYSSNSDLTPQLLTRTYLSNTLRQLTLTYNV